MLKLMEERYSTLLMVLQGFVSETANSNIKKEFFEEQYRSFHEKRYAGKNESIM